MVDKTQYTGDEIPPEGTPEYYRYMSSKPKAGRPRSEKGVKKRPDPKLPQPVNGYELAAESKGATRQRLSKSFLRDMYTDWEAHGKEVLATVRADDPASYLRVMASLIPKNLNITDNTDGKTVTELRSELLVELGRALERGDAQLVEHVEGLQRGERQGPVIDLQAVQETEGVPHQRSESS